MGGHHAIRIEGREAPVDAEGGQTILEACLAADVPMPYNCRSGECAECRAELLAGEVEEAPGADPAVFTDADRDKGRILTCLCSPVSDVAIAIALRDGVAAPRVERVLAPVARVERVCHSVVQVEVETPAPIPYRAGQYFEWVLPGVAPNRNFSAANRPGTGRIAFDIRLYPGGQASGYVQERLAPGDAIEIVGPFGRFGFSDNVHRPALCVAGGTGLAPIKAMIETDIAARSGRPITLFYGARADRDVYDRALLDRWASEHAGFTYRIALSDEPIDSGWTGARGPVTELVEETVFDGFGVEAYLCGPPPMIDAALPILEAIGIDRDDVYADRFTPAKGYTGSPNAGPVARSA